MNPVTLRAIATLINHAEVLKGSSKPYDIGEVSGLASIARIYLMTHDNIDVRAIADAPILHTPESSSV